jgi:capsular exopolysaccharide synthesis family protein
MHGWSIGFSFQNSRNFRTLNTPKLKSNDMSRIFDALQQSERERAGTDSPVPQGPELLKRAEHQAASEWSEAADPKAQFAAEANELKQLLDSSATHVNPPAASQAFSPESSSAVERHLALSRIQPLPISLSEQSRLVCLTDKDSATAEALRLLAVRLRDIRRTKPLKKVLITSTIPQEGKSTIAGNLACAFSHATDERILLIEGDLRRPSLSRMFGVRTKLGICDSLRDESGVLQNVYRLKEANLWILPAGNSPANPLEVLQSSKLPGFLNELAKYFDWILIDSPPVLPLADTSIWMRLADGIILVTRQGTTEKRQLQKGIEALDSEKVLGALVNSSVASAYSGYYYRSPSHT